jgi:hypothetical protein
MNIYGKQNDRQRARLLDHEIEQIKFQTPLLFTFFFLKISNVRQVFLSLCSIFRINQLLNH